MKNLTQSPDDTHRETENGSIFAELCYGWLVKKKIGLCESSYAKYSYLFERHIIMELGNIKVDEMRLSIIEQGITNIYRHKEGNAVSISTMKSILYLTNSVLDYGARLGYFAPMKAVFQFPVSKYTEISILKSGQETKLLSYLCGGRHDNYLGIMLSLLTGMRLGEVCALQRKNVDIEKLVICVKTTVQRLKSMRQEDRGKTMLMLTAPKSRTSYREIPFPAFLLYYFKKYGITEMKPDDFILGGKEIPYEPRTLQYGFCNALKKCGIEPMNYHCLRHTFASKCIKLGFDAKTLSEILGHTSVGFTLNRYVHSDMEQKRSQMNLIGQSYERLKLQQ